MNPSVNTDFIESELTVKAFGHSPESLTRGSHKRVIARCEFCRKTFCAIFKNLVMRSRAVVCSKCARISGKYFSAGLKVDRHEYWKRCRPAVDLSLIDVKASMKRFGHASLDPSSKVNKRIVAKCEFCLRQFETTLASIHKNQRHICCKECGSVAVKFGMKSLMSDKHAFYVCERENREKRLSSVGLSGIAFGPGSETRLRMTCDFCRGSFMKPVKYVDFDRKCVTCPACIGTSAAFHRQSDVSDKHEFWVARRPDIDWSFMDVDETISKYGHDPRSLTRGSHRKVVVRCCFCGEAGDSSFHHLVKAGGRRSCTKCRRRKGIETLQRRYGASSVLEIPGVKDRSNDPLTERIVETMLRDTFGVEYRRHYEVPFADGKSYEFDFYVPPANLLIECQGDHFHDFKKNGYSGTPKDRAKASFIELHTDFNLMWVWEHEIHMGRVNKMLGYHLHRVMEPEIEVKSVKNVDFRRVDDAAAHSFLSQYHYLGSLGTASTCYGGFIEDNLVCICTFGGTTRQNTFKKVKKLTGRAFGAKQLKELRRFCIRPNVRAKRLASHAIRKCIEAFRTDFPATKAVISFSDPTVGDSGSVYKYAGWQQLAGTGASYHYIDPVTCRMIHKKTVWDVANRSHMKESDFANASGLIKVAERSKSMWIRIF